MKSVDALLDRQYDPKKYHCVHFLIEAAQYLLNKDYSASFMGLTGDLAKSIQTSRDTTIKNKRLERPKDGCIVLMTN
ncbi:hypothetical protein ACNPNW_15835, partial [Acinetobacter sp. AGC35]